MVLWSWYLKLNTVFIPHSDAAERYKLQSDVVSSYGVLSVGVACFQWQPSPDSMQTLCKVETFNIWLLSQQSYTIDPSSAKFLIDHGFDFNKQFRCGLPYSPVHAGLEVKVQLNCPALILPVCVTLRLWNTNLQIIMSTISFQGILSRAAFCPLWWKIKSVCTFCNNIKGVWTKSISVTQHYLSVGKTIVFSASHVDIFVSCCLIISFSLVHTNHSCLMAVFTCLVYLVTSLLLAALWCCTTDW